MTDILEFILIIIGIWLAFSAGFIIWRRCKLYKRINRLKKETGAEIKYVKPPFLSLFKISKVPEITVKLGNKIYLIRTFFGGGIGKVVHFASEEWLVRFSRLRAAGYSKRRLGEKIVNARSGFAVGTKVFRLPRLDLSAYREDGREVIPVIIFNPAPGEVSYVTKEKTAILDAYTGDSVLGTLVFTSSTFPTFAEREYRRELYERELIEK